jgi:uncharacterized membrane protein YkvA (DUF1232 family)
MKIALLILTIIYTLSPVDAISDFLLGLGWMDDATLWGLLGWYWFFLSKKTKRKKRVF